jgi:hypothetical protein
LQTVQICAPRKESSECQNRALPCRYKNEGRKIRGRKIADDEGMMQFNKHFLNRGFRGYARINTIDPRRAYPRPSAVFQLCGTPEFSLVPAEAGLKSSAVQFVFVAS